MKKTISMILLLSLMSALLLCGCAGPEEKAWQEGQKALAEEKYGDAIAAFEKAGSMQDAEQLLAYARAMQDLEDGGYAKAGEGFNAMGDFKDSLLMVSYCRAREQEAAAQTAFSSGETDTAVTTAGEALEGYDKLALFRDSDDRAASCRGLLYSQANEWMNLGKYEAAASGFSALGNWQDSDELQKYCKAAALEADGAYAAAAELFAEIPKILDSKTRANGVLGQAYQHALDLKENGDYEAALDAFAQLGDYKDVREQAESTSVLQIRSLLRSGSCAAALEKLNLLENDAAFQAADPAANEELNAFLHSFLSTWMNAHAGIMTGFFSRNLLQPYVVSGGELETQIQTELSDESYPQNYGFVYQGTEVEKLLSLDDGFTAARVKGTASWYGPEGPVEKQENILVLVDSRQGKPLAAAVLSLTQGN